MKFDDDDDELTQNILNMKIDLPIKRTVVEDTMDDDLMVSYFQLKFGPKYLGLRILRSRIHVSSAVSNSQESSWERA